jgi:hypothetical protein
LAQLQAPETRTAQTPGSRAVAVFTPGSAWWAVQGSNL